jgi:hypothetical protein
MIKNCNLLKKIKIKFLVVHFFNFRSSNPGSGSGIRIRDPDPESGSAIRKNAGSGSVSGSALNQCGSETLQATKAGGIDSGLLKSVKISSLFSSKNYVKC